MQDRLDAVGVGVGAEAPRALARGGAHLARAGRAPPGPRRRARPGRPAGRAGRSTPSSTTSARPPTRVATTGVPAAIASASTVPNGSWREGATSTSRWRITRRRRRRPSRSARRPRRRAPAPRTRDRWRRGRRRRARCARRAAGADRGRGVDEVERPLARLDPPDEADDRRRRRPAARAAGASGRRARPGSRRRAASRPRQPVGDGARVGEHGVGARQKRGTRSTMSWTCRTVRRPAQRRQQAPADRAVEVDEVVRRGRAGARAGKTPPRARPRRGRGRRAARRDDPQAGVGRGEATGRRRASRASTCHAA